MTDGSLIFCIVCNDRVWAIARRTPDRIAWYCPHCHQLLDSEYVDYDYYGTDYEP